jgi:hypothetical protein
MNRLIVACLGAGLLCLSCTHAQNGIRRHPGSADFNATGEMEFNLGTGASFNADRVVGSNAELRRADNGSWRGMILNQPVDVAVTPEGLNGATLTMSIQQSPKGWVMTGLWQQRQILRFEYSQEKLLVRTPSQSLDLINRGDGSYETESLVCHGGLKLMGEAADPNPPNPQFALALIATFLPRTQNMCHASLVPAVLKEPRSAEMR